MEGSKKFEEAALRGVGRHHVWKSRTSDLTIVSLRDPTELLGTQESAVAAAPASTATAPAAAELKQPTATPPQSSQARPSTGKQEILSALLSKLQLGRPATEAAAPTKPPSLPVSPPTSRTTPPAAAAASAAHSTAPSPAAAPTAPSPAAAPAAVSPQPAVASYSFPPPAPSPPARAVVEHTPLFPDPKASSSSPQSGQFEFITGTNIPGQGVVKKAEAINEASSMALFHDPLWGGSSLLDTFADTPAPKKSPKPQARPILSELYGSGVASAFQTAPSLPPQTPVASPPVAAMTTTPVQQAMAPQSMPMMGGMMQAPLPQMNAPYPMYTMPLQYMAQPQFPGGVVYNSTAFFPYGATTVMMPQAQQMQQAYAMPTAAMMRPGTNVKAMPFVPGSTM